MDLYIRDNKPSTMASYASLVASSVKPTGQFEPITGRTDMIQNRSGAYTFKVSDDTMIERILILGTNRPTYYATAHALTKEATTELTRLITEGKGDMILDKLIDIYDKNRAPKLDPLMYVLAMLTTPTTPVEVRKRALNLVSRLRTFSQVYSWKGIHKILCGSKGFGRAVRDCIDALVRNIPAQQLAYQATKYRSRKIGNETWSIDDLISCSHVVGKTLKLDSQLVVAYIVVGIDAARKFYVNHAGNPDVAGVMEYLEAVDVTRADTATVESSIPLIQKYNLPREVISTHLLNNQDVWKALLSGVNGSIKMPITALLRNLGKMSNVGLFSGHGGIELATKVVAHITNIDVLKKGNVHPIALLVAYLVYGQGHGDKGSLSWDVSSLIKEGLMAGFYIAFGTVQPTGKRIMHAFDASGSMRSSMACCPKLTACGASAALGMAFARSEPVSNQRFFIFADKSEMEEHRNFYSHRYNRAKGTDFGVDVSIKETDSFENVCNIININNGGGTDCALPMLKAHKEFTDAFKAYKISHPDGTLQTYKDSNTIGLYDAFIIYTDNETNSVSVHPKTALDQYRAATGLDSKLIVIAATPGANTIGDPTDLNILDIAGFDLNAPSLIRSHLIGQEDVSTGDIDDTDE